MDSLGLIFKDSTCKVSATHNFNGLIVCPPASAPARYLAWVLLLSPVTVSLHTLLPGDFANKQAKKHNAVGLCTRYTEKDMEFIVKNGASLPHAYLFIDYLLCIIINDLY